MSCDNVVTPRSTSGQSRLAAVGSRAAAPATQTAPAVDDGPNLGRKRRGGFQPSLTPAPRTRRILGVCNRLRDAQCAVPVPASAAHQSGREMYD